MTPESGSSAIATVDIIDTKTEDQSSNKGVAQYSGDLEVAVCRIVKQDPFSSIGEIKDEINRGHRESRATWWAVFSVLKKKRLLRRKSRFRYAWGRSL